MSLQETRPNNGNPVPLEVPETRTHPGSASLRLTVDAADGSRSLRAVLLDGEQRPLSGVELRFSSGRWTVEPGRIVTDSQGEAVSRLIVPEGGLRDYGGPDLASVRAEVVLGAQVVIPRARAAVKAWELASREHTESHTHTPTGSLSISLAEERGLERAVTLVALLKNEQGEPLRGWEVQFATGMEAFEPVGMVHTDSRGEARCGLTVGPGGEESSLVVPVRATVVLGAEVDLSQVGAG